MADGVLMQGSLSLVTSPFLTTPQKHETVSVPD